MLTLKFIQENKDLIIERLKIKNFQAEDIVSQILDLDQKRCSTQNSMDSNQAELNKMSKEIGVLFKKAERKATGIINRK